MVVATDLTTTDLAVTDLNGLAHHGVLSIECHRLDNTKPNTADCAANPSWIGHRAQRALIEYSLNC